MSIRTILFVTLLAVGLFMGALHAGALACQGEGGKGAGWTQGYPGQEKGPSQEEQWWRSGSYPGSWKPGNWSTGSGFPTWGDPGAHPKGKHRGGKGQWGGKSQGHGGQKRGR